MHRITSTTLTLLSLLSLTAAVPTTNPPTGGAYSCSNYTVNWDDLPATSGQTYWFSKTNYKTLYFYDTGSWSWGSKGLNNVTALVPDSKDHVTVDVKTHSGNNALVQNNWGDDIFQSAFGVVFDAGADNRVCHASFFDFQSVWVRGHTGAAFTFGLRCYTENSNTPVQQTFKIPASGGFTSVKPDPKRFKKIWRCHAGDAAADSIKGGSLVLMDDMRVRMCNINTC